jgi:rare lipoprotein A
MKKNILFLCVLLVTVLFIPQYSQGQTYGKDVFRQEGIASWYGREFDGRPTASGEIYDSSQFTAAHPDMPFGTVLIITNKHNDKKVTVRVNDRGPFVAARIIDVSRAAAEQLDMIVTGTAPVIVESVERIDMSVPVVKPVTLTPAAETPSVNMPVLPMPVVSALVSGVVNTGNSAPVDFPQQQAEVKQIVQSAAVVYIPQQSAVTQLTDHAKLIPEISIAPNKTYRLQAGSYKAAKNAVDAFDKLKSVGLNPVYERYANNNEEYFRVILPGMRGSDVQSAREKLMSAGFKEAVIREEE